MLTSCGIDYLPAYEVWIAWVVVDGERTQGPPCRREVDAEADLCNLVRWGRRSTLWAAAAVARDWAQSTRWKALSW